MLAAILKTKPRTPECIATNAGWVNPLNNEVLVSFKLLKDKLDKLQPILEKPIMIEPVTTQPSTEVEVPAKRKYKKTQQLIGEVMEYPNVDFTPDTKEVNLG